MWSCQNTMEARKHFFLFIKNYTFFFLELSTFFAWNFHWKCFKLENFCYSVLGMKNGQVNADCNVNVGLLQFFASQNMLSHVSYSFKTVLPSF